MAFGRGRKAVGLLAGLALVAGAAACGGSGNDSAAGGNKITVATVAADSGAQGFLAKEKGFYKAQGLEVEVQIVAGVPELAAAVQSGKAQFALTSPTSVAGASASGIPFRVVAGGVKYTKKKPGVWLMVADRAKDVKSLKDLGGKSIAVNALNTLPHLSTLAALDDAGVDVKKVNFVTLNFPAIGQALESGQVPAGAVVSPFTDQQEAGKIAHRLVSPYDAVNNGEDFLNTVWFGKEDYIAKNPEVADKFRAALRDTNKWANDPANETERKKILQKYADLPDAAVAALELSPYGDEVSAELLQPLLDVMYRFEALKKPMKAETIIAKGAN
ncbi:MAG TPA: ABC transporter substrate-binding protein [Mycobacteriales bacterium]|nr:ABC transporter substrate-binding protein [Mycobacteriales bacterium]